MSEKHKYSKFISLIRIPMAVLLLGSFLSSCREISVGHDVWVSSGGAMGTYPYTTYKGPGSDAYNCKIPEGQHKVQEVDSRFGIIKIRGCWIKPENTLLSWKPPKSTPTPFPTQDVWIRATGTPQK